jgi:DAK2 domain fusion protein YloV
MSGEAAATALTLARGGQAALELHRQRIDDLNVYPVPDGDTGSNLLDTAVALTNGLAELTGDAGREEIARAATRSALMGARGNSGVILSQIVRGFAESLGAEPGAIDGHAVARAVRAASESAYHAVRQPVEGTMLTAVREMAEAAEAAPDLPLPALLDRMLEAGDRAVEHTPELLAALRDAGVVDAGAAGLVEFARGAAAASRGERITAPASIAAARPLGVEALHAEPSRYRYCTTFLVEGDGIDAVALERDLDVLGDSLLVVGEPPTVKVHVHTDDPPAALALGLAMGVVDRVEIANMHTQTAERERRLRVVATRPATAVVAIVAGEGNESAYRAAGASRIVAGGQSMNPSAGEIAQAIAAADAEGVVVLPNNGNVILAAEHAASLADRPVRVVPTRSVATGLALMEGYSPSAPLAQTADAMARRNAALRYGELTTAVRDARVDGVAVHDGEHLALVDGRVVASTGDAAAAADAMLGRLAEDGAERIVLLRGDADAFDPGPWLARARLAHPQVQLELRDGGQPLYPLLAWAEGRVLLTAENTALVLDSTSDAGSPQGLPANWRVVPLSVRLGDRSYLDYVEMPPEEFYRRLPLEAELPQTAAPAPGAFQTAFEELAGYSRIIVLPISSQVSATSRSAEIAARELDPSGERILVLETHAVSAATLLLADGLQRLLVRGVPENTLVTWFEEAKARLSLLFSVETLEFLRKGGRIGRAQAAVGGLLRVRPLLTLQDGEVASFGRVRGASRVLPAFERYLCEHLAEGQPGRIALCHARTPAAVESLQEMIARVRPTASVDHVLELGAVVGTHGGPGTVGMAVLTGE